MSNFKTKKVKTHLSLLAIAIAIVMINLSSCESEDFGKEIINDEVEAIFKTTISNIEKSTTKTRATGTTWHQNDSIGIFAIKGDQTLSEEAIYNDYRNVKYINPTEGESVNFTAATDKIMLPATGEIFDFITYYPYNPLVTDFTLNIDISTQEPHSSIDILYATAKGYSYENPDVELHFSHMLSQLQLQLTSTDGKTVEGATIIIQNAQTNATMNLVDGTITSGAEKKSLTPVIISNSSNNLTATAILLPGQDLSKLKITILLVDGSNYVWTTPDAYILESNTTRIYKLNLKHGEVELTNPGSTIGSWIEDIYEPTLDVNPTPVDSTEIPEIPEIPGDGTQLSPYTVSQAIAKSDETDVWVQGYIVGYMDNEYDKGGNFLSTEFTSNKADKNIVLADGKSETDLEFMIPIKVSTETTGDPAPYEALNLKSNSGLLGKRVKIKCDLEQYMGGAGGKNVKEFEL